MSTLLSYFYRDHKIGDGPVVWSNRFTKMVHINIPLKCIIVKYWKLQTIHENTSFEIDKQNLYLFFF